MSVDEGSLYSHGGGVERYILTRIVAAVMVYTVRN